MRPGTCRGDVVLTVALARDVTYETLTFPFRQALHADGTGVDRQQGRRTHRRHRRRRRERRREALALTIS
ncbi:hypothetical protein [Streptomyces sp. NPDC002588]|uniref:hypothetical protein n=1 Tax=Streptomyces sp. NPDC002588 TaxID=3154419 RepID=UPI00331B46B6